MPIMGYEQGNLSFTEELMKRVYIQRADGSPQALGELIGKTGLTSPSRLIYFSEAMETLPKDLRESYLTSLAQTAALMDLGIPKTSVILDPNIQSILDHQTERAKEYLKTLFEYKGLMGE